MVMQIEVHGGKCCGIAHIHNLGSWPSSDKVRVLKTHITNFKKGETAQPCPWIRHKRRGCLEVTLADTQLKNPPAWWQEGNPKSIDKSWETVLLGLGFKEVNSFYNSNSGNKVKIFHKNV